MSHSLFDSIKSLHYKLNIENLDIHNTQKDLNNIILLGKKTAKLRIITQFLSVLESLARNYEYEDAQAIAIVKDIIKKGLELILDMVDDNISNSDGVYKIETIVQNAKELLIQKLGNKVLLNDEKLLSQFANDLLQDIGTIKEFFATPILVTVNKQYYETMKYYLQKIQDSVLFIGIQELLELTSAFSSFIDAEYKNNTFSELGSHTDFISTLEYYEKTAHTILIYNNNIQEITRYFSENAVQDLIEHLLSMSSNTTFTQPLVPTLVLTNEEIGALLDNENTFDSVSFDDQTAGESVVTTVDEKTDSDKTMIPVQIAHSEYQTLMKQSLKTPACNDLKYEELYDVSQEEFLIRYVGRMFQKQDLLFSELTEEKAVKMTDDLLEIKSLTTNIKKILFDHYYISIEALLGTDIREYIHKEVKKLGKKLRLGIRGENSEILTRESEFVKHIIFTLVKNSIHYSLEPTFRRKATDKNEMGWLLIEFEDAGDNFDIYIRDDGRGIVVDQMNLVQLQEQVANKGGKLEIDSMDNEYLKIHVQLPMKKILTDCLVVQLRDTKVLIPNRCIDRVIDVKESLIAMRDDKCLGQVNLATILGIDNVPTKMLVICDFGAKKVIFGVEKILYSMEAVVEYVDVPLLPCVDQVSIIKDGTLGFIINEKKLYQKSKHLILQREKIKELS